MRRGWVLVAVVLATGVAGTGVTLHDREGNSEFSAAQSSLKRVSGGAIENIILTTGDPRPGFSGRARAVHCLHGGGGALGNPWTCVTRYSRQPDVRYRVVVRGDGSIFGEGQPEGTPVQGVLTVHGCCVNTS
jgi:hypothetical protein